ncbi:Rv1535 domain-containing protein [Mycobacterium sp. 1465703.0]|uniref:Rv1535 domain-containing protein n=1 Tax=Mycobacterium sp. 1465703.0 TaxID=1834078 RepID=UPI0009F5D40F|nr:Rv1535 domain-containing protein [Mycobacterium sp. 1465703.0]
MTHAGGDPLVSSVASVLRVPLVELYALLWRVGVVEIRQNDRAPHRSAKAPSRVVRGPICPDPSAHRADRTVRWTSQQLASAGYRRATG